MKSIPRWRAGKKFRMVDKGPGGGGEKPVGSNVARRLRTRILDESPIGVERIMTSKSARAGAVYFHRLSRAR